MLTRNDILNLKNLLNRANYAGVEEAEVAVSLNNKLTRMLNKQFTEEVNGRNIPNNDQPSS